MKYILLLSACLGFTTAQGLIPGVSNGCFEPKATGQCRAFIPSFFYNPLTGTCDCFIFGGCSGNANRFDTLAQCVTTCNVNPRVQSVSQRCQQIFRDPKPFDLSNLLIAGPHGQPEDNFQNIQVPQNVFNPPQVQPIRPSVPAPPPATFNSAVVNPFANEFRGIPLNNARPSFGQEGPSVSAVLYNQDGTRTGTLTIGRPVLLSLLNTDDDDK